MNQNSENGGGNVTSARKKRTSGTTTEKKIRKDKPSEYELAMRQAEKMQRDMQRTQSFNATDPSRKATLSGPDVFLDSDFFFSVVFQSSRQKYVFLEELSKKLRLGIDKAQAGDVVIQVLNGISLAESLGIKLEPEKGLETPYPNLELAKLALDDAQF